MEHRPKIVVLSEVALWGTIGCAILLPIRAFPLDGYWLDALRLPALAYTLLPCFAAVWSVFSLVSMRRGVSPSAVRALVVVLLLVGWGVVGVAGLQVNAKLHSLDQHARKELGSSLALDSDPLALALPSPYSPPQQRSFWEGAAKALKLRRWFLDYPVVDVSLGTARLERANALIAAGAHDAGLRAPTSTAPAGSILGCVVAAKFSYADGDLDGALEQMAAAEAACESLDDLSRNTALIALHIHRLYYDAAEAASRDDMALTAELLIEYGRWSSERFILECVAQDPAFAGFRVAPEYGALQSLAQ